MPYIGVSPTGGVRKVFSYTATAGQTSFSGSDNNSQTLSYSDSNFIDVFQNGVLLLPSDYTATTGTTVVLDTGATVSDSIQITVFDVFSVADTVSKADGGTFDGNVTMGGTLAVTGNVTMAGTHTVTGVSILDGGVDVAGNLTLDADSGSIILKDGGTQFGLIAKTSNDLGIYASIADEDIVFKGTDGSTAITALTLDMSASGDAIFNRNANFGDGGRARFGASSDLQIYHENGGANNIYGSTAHHLDFSTSDTFRMRLKDDGKLLLNTTSVANARLVSVADLSAMHTCTFRNSDNNTGGIFLRQQNHAGQDCGNITQTGSTTVSYGTSSDYRLKENVSYDFDATTRLKQLKPARFNFIADGTDKVVDGFLAHEAQTIVPESVVGEKDATETLKNVVLLANDIGIVASDITEAEWTQGKIDGIYASDTSWTASKTIPKYQQIDQAKLVPLLTKALQEALAEIDTLKTKVATLESK
jgi:hypothetical protein